MGKGHKIGKKQKEALNQVELDGKKSGKKIDKGKAGARQPANPKTPAICGKKDSVAVPLKGVDIFLVNGVLNTAECDTFIEFAEQLKFEHQGSRGAAFGEAYRDNDRVAITDETLASQLWTQTGLSQIFTHIKLNGEVAVGLNPNLRFYKYSKGQKFGRHVDESCPMGNGLATRYTLLVYLSGELTGKNSKKTSYKCQQPLVGGETVFYGNKNRVLASVKPAPGLALLHIHGDDCNEHEAMQVQSGLKYVLRSDVIFSKPK